MSYLITFFSLAAICALTLLVIKRGKLHIFSASTFFILFAIVDVMFPALVWSSNEYQYKPEWLDILQPDEIAAGLFFYSTFYGVFIATFLIGEKTNIFHGIIAVPSRSFQRTLLCLCIIFIFLNSTKILYLIEETGGIYNWILLKAGAVENVRINNDISERDGFLLTLPFGSAFQALAGVGFFYRNRTSNRLTFTYTFPLLALLFAIINFFRGSLLTWFITFTFSEYIRRLHIGEKHIKHSHIQFYKYIFLIGLWVLVSVYGFGTIRDSLRNESSGVEPKQSIELPKFFTAGHGLLGVSHIVKNFGDNIDYMYGRTYFDMLLLPIPRSIYKAKPIWYGIDDITAAMGWPQTTQSAVTLPGEAYANFGIFGAFLGIPIAYLFIHLQNMIKRNIVSLVLLGPTIIFSLPSVANWMAFTGIMNSILLIFILFSLQALLTRKNNITTHLRQ